MIAAAPATGRLLPFSEQGMEGVVWCVEMDGRRWYDALHPLRDGDHLAVLADDGSLEWAGFVDLDRAANAFESPVWHQQVDGYWVRGLQRGVEPETWSNWFRDGRPARVVPRADPPG